MRGLARPRVAAVLSGAPFAYLAVETSGGPHVTPLLFAFTPDRLWFGIARRTLKARMIRRRADVAVVIPGQQASVAVRGRATLLDHPSPTEFARAPFALPVFAGRNALEMAAFLRDIARTRTAPAPLTPVSVRIDRLDVLDGWSAEAVLGWMTDEGPLALPAHWDAQRSRARVPAGPLKEAGRARRAPACVCVDESQGRLGPVAKRGRLYRGAGQATVRGETATVVLDVQRVTQWKGFDTRTTPAGII